MTAEDQPTLPGFELPRPGENRIGQAAIAQLEKLRVDGVLTDEHAIVAQLVLSLAQSVGGSLAAGKLTIAGVQGAKLLIEAIELLPEGSGGAMGELTAMLRAVS